MILHLQCDGRAYRIVVGDSPCPILFVAREDAVKAAQEAVRLAADVQLCPFCFRNK